MSRQFDPVNPVLQSGDPDWSECPAGPEPAINHILTLFCSLVTLTGQNALLGLSMRFARTRPGDMFISTTAVFMAEIGQYRVNNSSSLSPFLSPLYII